jgi:cytochrome b involved in lipid metabolism
MSKKAGKVKKPEKETPDSEASSRSSSLQASTQASQASTQPTLVSQPSQGTQPSQGSMATRQITLEELKTHNKREDAWMALRGLLFFVD